MNDLFPDPSIQRKLIEHYQYLLEVSENHLRATFFLGSLPSTSIIKENQTSLKEKSLPSSSIWERVDNKDKNGRYCLDTT